ncbi:hypothetical protein Salat_2700400 [Sesamum alatum]|uniref:Uncharacterized protein n=1 Tax=Sesamum alatum TaxID=300844 RepID=A0AAE1XPZ7_9LAMI|nr:hypothetical protein Salat_2700400 [Sesamum alatum]
MSASIEFASGDTNMVANLVEETPLGLDPAVKAIPAGSKDMDGEVALVTGEPSKSKKRKRKHKNPSKISSKSSKRPECRAAKEAAEEEENTKHLKELGVWWKQAREELKDFEQQGRRDGG